MSQARISKLQALLKRVETRKVAPRLQVVAQPIKGAAPAAAPAALDFEELAPDTLPPTPEPARKVPSSSPLESALGQLDDSGPLQVQALAEPIAPARREDLAPAAFTAPAPAMAPFTPPQAIPAVPPPPQISVSLPAASLSQDSMLTHRPEAGPGDFDMPIELTQPAKKAQAPAEARPAAPREPTIEFETAKVRVSARDARTMAESAAVEAPLVAPSQTIEASPLAQGAAPARAVSAARIEAPKTFGELLERSLSLRPR
jgi:hypothetical protein